jgi:hypothetical protein
MQGELVIEARGKSTGMRVIPAEGQVLKIEVSFINGERSLALGSGRWISDASLFLAAYQRRPL